eukprot:scaffold2109_cov216-Cylindrotheca_fusiformis.AAC.2
MMTINCRVDDDARERAANTPTSLVLKRLQYHWTILSSTQRQNSVRVFAWPSPGQTPQTTHAGAWFVDRKCCHPSTFYATIRTPLTNASFHRNNANQAGAGLIKPLKQLFSEDISALRSIT